MNPVGVCYYCGKTAKHACDYLGADGKLCERNICLDHLVSEYASVLLVDVPDAYTLCKDHAYDSKP